MKGRIDEWLQAAAKDGRIFRRVSVAVPYEDVTSWFEFDTCESRITQEELKADEEQGKKQTGSFRPGGDRKRCESPGALAVSRAFQRLLPGGSMSQFRRT